MSGPQPARARPIRRAIATLGLGGAGLLAATGGGIALTLGSINRVRRFDAAALRQLREGESSPLFRAFPRLADRIPWRPLGELPTPVEEIPPPDGAPGIRLFVKRDDLAAGRYGGNKVRKLEHFLAEAELASRRTLITLGGTGSNHALATAIHGAALGFETDLVLYDQPDSDFVRRNQEGFAAAGARVHFGGGIGGAFARAAALQARRTREGAKPYFIMVGGTSRLGCIGHVSTGLEIAEQVAAGVFPEPDRIFVPLGTCGTAAGLVVGLRLAGLRSRTVAVRVAEPFVSNGFLLRHLAQDVADFLHEADRSLPKVRISTDDFDVVTDHLGPGYGLATPAADAAIRWAEPRLSLDPTYSGKAMAACGDYCRGAAPGSVILFLNTYSSAPLPVSGALRSSGSKGARG